MFTVAICKLSASSNSSMEGNVCATPEKLKRETLGEDEVEEEGDGGLKGDGETNACGEGAAEWRDPDAEMDEA